MDVGIASLPWYDLPEIRGETDRLWRRIAEALRARGVHEAPDHLLRGETHDRPWYSSRFLLGQCCGYDLVLPHAGRLQPVATPAYASSRTGPGRYRSLVVVGSTCDAASIEDLRGLRCAVNGATSHSGMGVLSTLVAPHSAGGRFFSRVTITGSHESSVEALQRGDSDVAAIDSVVFALLERYRPSALYGLRVLCETPDAGAPPYVTSAATSPERLAHLRAALQEAMADPNLAKTREALLLEGIVGSSPAAYREILDGVRRAREFGYCILRDTAVAA